MLVIRYLRQGRKNQAFFRVVLTEKGNPPKSKFQKVFGWYNPKTKESSLNKEDILEWVNKGAKPSNSVAKLLIDNKITHKHIVFTPDAPGKTKKKPEEKKEAPKSEAETSQDAEVSTDNGAQEKSATEPKAPEEETSEVAEEPKPEAKADKKKPEEETPAKQEENDSNKQSEPARNASQSDAGEE
jgi:small subunit ribosomal protein S16